MTFDESLKSKYSWRRMVRTGSGRARWDQSSDRLGPDGFAAS